MFCSHIVWDFFKSTVKYKCYIHTIALNKVCACTMLINRFPFSCCTWCSHYEGPQPAPRSDVCCLKPQPLSMAYLLMEKRALQLWALTTEYWDANFPCRYSCSMHWFVFMESGGKREEWITPYVISREVSDPRWCGTRSKWRGLETNGPVIFSKGTVNLTLSLL